jgi:hypothetical protein
MIFIVISALLCAWGGRSFIVVVIHEAGHSRTGLTTELQLPKQRTNEWHTRR